MSRARLLLLQAVASSPTGLVVLLDLDDMTRINRRFGTRVGDRLIARIESALRAAVGGRGDAVNIGGDRFLAVVTDYGERDAVVQDLVRACSRARIRFARVTASAGGCEWTDCRSEPHELLSAAESALDLTKRATHLRRHRRPRA
jgi:diguanylate cyclase (GGDEF)-like protein